MGLGGWERGAPIHTHPFNRPGRRQRHAAPAAGSQDGDGSQRVVWTAGNTTGRRLVRHDRAHSYVMPPDLRAARTRPTALPRTCTRSLDSVAARKRTAVEDKRKRITVWGDTSQKKKNKTLTLYLAVTNSTDPQIVSSPSAMAKIVPTGVVQVPSLAMRTPGI